MDDFPTTPWYRKMLYALQRRKIIACTTGQDDIDSTKGSDIYSLNMDDFPTTPWYRKMLYALQRRKIIACTADQDDIGSTKGSDIYSLNMDDFPTTPWYRKMLYALQRKQIIAYTADQDDIGSTKGSDVYSLNMDDFPTTPWYKKILCALQRKQIIACCASVGALIAGATCVYWIASLGTEVGHHTTDWRTTPMLIPTSPPTSLTHPINTTLPYPINTTEAIFPPCQKNRKGYQKIRNITPSSIDKNSQLMVCIKNNDTQSVQKLIQAGADINFQDKQGNTPLHLAVKHNNTDIINILLCYYPNLEAENHNKLVPLAVAISESNILVAEQLIKYGMHYSAITNERYYNSVLSLAKIQLRSTGPNSHKFKNIINLLNAGKEKLFPK